MSFPVSIPLRPVACSCFASTDSLPPLRRSVLSAVTPVKPNGYMSIRRIGDAGSPPSCWRD